MFGTTSSAFGLGATSAGSSLFGSTATNGNKKYSSILQQNGQRIMGLISYVCLSSIVADFIANLAPLLVSGIDV